MASCSSANTSYDVFLSFRGPDTRNNLISHLHNALCHKNVKVFIDDNIERGEDITQFLMNIIEGAKISIIVFSSGYASSPSCLDELVKIMECKESKEQFVLPIFYKVETSVKIYEQALTEHRLREGTVDQEMKVERWESSLQTAFQLAGHHIDEHKKEATVIEEIKREVLERLKCQFEGAMQSTPIVAKTSEDYLEKIMQCLMNDKNPKVGVWGMGGVGKTTIVTHVNNRLLYDASFSRRIYWVTVSKDWSVSKLQGAIAKLIKLDFSGEDNESKRATKLFNELKRIKKFVLILDDVWEPFEIEDVGIPPLMDGRKLLLTTRSLRVCERMMCQPIEVKPLFQHEALELFMVELKTQINDSQEWRKIVLSIVKECAGLPLVIAVVARTMRGVKEIWTWRDTLRELQKPCEGENPEIEDKVFKVLKVSYDRLPNDRCRRCFLYCSLFPEDHHFYREELVEYWIGEGLIDGIESRHEELNKGHSILDELIHASLLELTVHSFLNKFSDDLQMQPIKMHDVIRDMAHKNVKVGLQFEDSFGSVQVLTMSTSFPNSISHCSKLRTLVLKVDDTKKLSNCFFANMRSLNILHIKSGSLMSIPSSINNLRNLKLLVIDCFYVESIPSLDELISLRVFRIALNNCLRKMSGIDRLVNLRVLDLSEILIKIEVEVEVLISLEKLQVLKVHFYNMQKLNSYVQSGHWRRLLEYDIYYGGHEVRIGQRKKEKWAKIMRFKAMKDVKELGIMFFTDDIQYLEFAYWTTPMLYYLKNPKFVNLQSICIIRHLRRHLFSIDSARHLLHNVQHLEIERSLELEEIIARDEEWLNPSNYINYPTILLPNLKTLRLRGLVKLRSIYRGRIVCPCLELLEIAACDNLVRLPFCMEKEGDKQNPTITLHGGFEWDLIPRKWWDSLQWDDQNSKSMYHPKLSKRESES